MLEERFIDLRSQGYDQDEVWDDYEDAYRETRHPRCFVPSPEEIRQGMLAVRWLRDQGFPDEFIRCVMVKHHPRLDLVQSVVRRRGPKQAYQLLRDFLP